MRLNAKPYTGFILRKKVMSLDIVYKRKKTKIFIKLKKKLAILKKTDIIYIVVKGV